MLRKVLLSLCVGLLGVCGASRPLEPLLVREPDRRVDGKIGDWIGVNSRTAGSTQFSAGEFVYGMDRLVTTRPDLWAVVVNYAGRATIKTGNAVDLIGNVREIPVLQATGTNDETVGADAQYRAPLRLSVLDCRRRWGVDPGYNHFSFARLENWAETRECFGEHRAPLTLRQVTYAFSPAWAGPAGEGLGLRNDREYWIYDLTRRSGDEAPFLDFKTNLKRTISDQI